MLKDMSNQQKFRQSVGYWCLADTEWGWDAEKICSTAKNLGIESVELAPADAYSTLRKHGLTCALCFNGMPGAPFVKGLNNPAYHEEIIARTKQSIDVAADYGFPNVIAFTGYKWRNAEDPASGEWPLADCFQNCVRGLSEIGAYAGRKNVTICLEHLNTRDGSHPMKGHPGYQGDDVDFCAEIVRKVDSPTVRLLFDFYHVQVMHGDLIRRYRAHHDVIGHVHTAGCPGRNDLDDTQEIHYPGIVAVLRQSGYTGFVGHEFIPTSDPVQALKAAVQMFES